MPAVQYLRGKAHKVNVLKVPGEKHVLGAAALFAGHAEARVERLLCVSAVRTLQQLASVRGTHIEAPGRTVKFLE